MKKSTENERERKVFIKYLNFDFILHSFLFLFFVDSFRFILTLNVTAKKEKLQRKTTTAVERRRRQAKKSGSRKTNFYAKDEEKKERESAVKYDDNDE
jgi:hypothetical protein